jgi:hypothetical protein
MLLEAMLATTAAHPKGADHHDGSENRRGRILRPLL